MVAILLALPVVQTKLGTYATDELKKEYGVDITVEKVAVNPFGGVKLKGVLVRDHHQDTLAHFIRIHTSILSYKKLYEKGHPYFGDLLADGLNFKIKQYKGEKDTNLDVFVAAFDDKSGKPSSGKFRLKINSISLKNSRFRYIDDNLKTPRVLDFTNLNGQLDDFFVKGANVSSYVYKLSFKDHRGLVMKNLTSDFTYTKKNILLNELILETENSSFKGKTELRYNRKDFKDFNNKVIFDLDIKEGKISSNDLNYFYPEFGKDQKFYIDSHIIGTLNDLKFDNLKFNDLNDNEVVGNLQLKNLFGKGDQKFYLKGSFDRLTTSQASVSKVLPNLLGKNLPKQLQKLGRVDLKGDVELTQKWIIADVDLFSKLGHVIGDFKMDKIDTIEKASYKGNFQLDNFDLGAFLDEKDLGRTSVVLDIDGTGFSKKYLNTKARGNVGQFKYNGYTYRNIDVNGTFKMPYFKGLLDSNDPNLKMTFDGLVDLSQRKKEYDFKANIAYANLKKTNLYTKDSKSILSGTIQMKAKGNSLEDLAGIVNLENISYSNQKSDYYFDNAFVTSSFDNQNVRTITLNSSDMIDGQVVGKYQTKQIRKILENAVGSLYANYSPHKLSKNQFLDFDFTIYNKILEVFYPDVTISENTRVKGKINADAGLFQFDFKSPFVNAYENKFNGIKIDIDNKNPLYNAYIELDSLNTKNYKISEFSLINLTLNDTLFARTEFKGGAKGEDKFDLNLFHTIDKNKQSVVGFKKSDITFKNYQWYINEKETNGNTVVFDKGFKNFTFNQLKLSHNDQFIDFNGVMNGNTFKDFNFTFNDVDISKVTPDIKNLTLGGKLNGDLKYKQDNLIYEPSTNLTVDSLVVNDIDVGDLKLDVSGDESFKKFNVDAAILHDNEETFFTTGIVEIINNKTILNLDAGFENFNIKPIGGFLTGILENVRGFVKGQAHIVGSLDNPEVDGVLYLSDAGMKVPYLNVDYDFDKNSIIDLTEEKFIFRDIEIQDVNEKTKGILSGTISHDKFADWEMDLKIASDRLLVLDTKDSDDAYYYGTAYFDGYATIEGAIEALVINAEGESAKGTSIKIPVNDSESVSDNGVVHFTTREEKYGINNVNNKPTKTYQGIDLNFNFAITPNTEIEVILNRDTGHSMKGTGNGSMNMNINTLGKFQMTGDFIVYKGEYLFRYGSIIDKKFIVKKGGTISWEGDPLGAKLNLEAVTTNITANPNVLLENSSFNKKIPTEVSILISGELNAPQSDFNINFPNVNSVLKSDLDYRLQDKDFRQQQSFALLATGGFFADKDTNFFGSLFEKASSIFGEVLSDGENRLKLGVNYEIGNPRQEISDRALVTLTTQINDRISINGNVGVPVGGINQSYVVGNVEVEMRLNADGTLTAQVFNKENDLNSNTIGQNVGYTQGIGLSYSVDFDDFKELLHKLFQSQKNKNNSDNPIDESDDSETNPEFINFIEETRKRQIKEEKKADPKNRVPDINDLN
ncbi:translocation/assembly module TamB [Flavobacterium sp. KDG-16]|uniref:Translocation/assembly module TamB n=1 Tax=Flavobacterium difficile TaxID=2709659 RepID=A0ABX0I7B3_9FLAO|nr:translocation/assembly module TamB [Flavobacterium difficile]